MLASYEAQLMALAVGLYLFDCTLLLLPNEGLLIAGRKGSWQAAPRSEDFLVAGRSLHVMNLFTPHRPVFRLAWNFDVPSAAAGTRRVSRQVADDISSVAPFTVTAGLSLYVLLPAGLFTPVAPTVALFAVVLLYVSIICGLWRLYFLNHASRPTGRSFATLAFECMACPPIGVNLVRRVSLAQRIDEEFPCAASRLLDADSWAQVQMKCAERIDYEIAGEENGSPRVEALMNRRRQFPQVRIPS